MSQPASCSAQYLPDSWVRVAECSARSGPDFLEVTAGFNPIQGSKETVWRSANCQVNTVDALRFSNEDLLISVGAVCAHVE